MRRQNRTRTLVFLAMLTALEIVLERFCSLQAWNLRIGFSFAALALAGMLFGPWAAGGTGAAGDLLGMLLFPSGAFFPGFTLTAILKGMVYGFLLHKFRSAGRIICAALVVELALSQCLQTLWISILYVSPYRAVFVARLTQTAVMIPVELLVLSGLSKAVRPLEKQLLQ